MAEPQTHGDRLVRFLLARIDEDQAAALAATPGPWSYLPSGEMAPWHPKRILAECAAKRRVVALADRAWPCQTLRALARVHHDHPDLDPAWG